MRGFPESFATKQDYTNCLGMYPEETKRLLKGLLAGRYTWVEVKKIESAAKGKEDAKHHVITQKVFDEKTKKETEVFVQLEKVEDKNARLFQLGFSVKEVENLIT